MGANSSNRLLVRAGLLAALIVAALVLTPHAHGKSRSCQVPTAGEWERVSPEQVGMDSRKLQEALDYGTQNASYAVRVFRRGCLVGADRFEPINDDRTYESWSLGKSITSLLFGAAMTEGMISAADPLGSLIPEADADHGAITMRDLLTMSAGLRWNGFRDYNIFTIRDRVRDALTLPVVHEPGTYWEYSQSSVSLVPKAVERATGMDPRRYLQGRILDHIGIEGESWDWQRDDVGNIQGFWGTRMRINDFGRVGELFRRDGRWRGQRLLSREYMREALTPARSSGCYGWLIWLAAEPGPKNPCIGVRVQGRKISRASTYPGMPSDMFAFSGLFGQIIVVFPSQELVLVRTGHDTFVNPTGGRSWQHGLFTRLLAAVTDEEVNYAKEFTGEDLPNEDYGFQNAISEPDQYSQGAFPEDLPPAGPGRARAAILSKSRYRVTRRGRVIVTVRCPARWPAKGLSRCRGVAKMQGARSARRYSIAAGRAAKVRFRLRRSRQQALRGNRSARVTLRNRDRADGARSATGITIG